MGSWRRSIHWVNSQLLRIHPVVWLIALLLLARGACAYEPVYDASEPLVWLVVVYMPIAGEPVPYVRFYKIERSLCHNEARQIYKDASVSKAHAFCL